MAFYSESLTGKFTVRSFKTKYIDRKLNALLIPGLPHIQKNP